MLSAVQHQQFEQFVVPEINDNKNTTIRNDKNFRTTEIMEDNENFYFLGQHLNSSGLLLQDDEEEEEEVTEEYHNTPNNFEIANRAFYATINKFTRQSCPDASKRRSPPYSFLENWHLHSIYSKSQQTLLGITPVRPAVLLSGDDFMFTPPFIQEDEEEEYNDEYMMTDEEEDILDWDRNEGDATEFYHLSPCPDSNGLLYIEQQEKEDEEEDQDSDNEDNYRQHRLFRQDITISSPTNLLFETPSTSLNNDNTTATNKQQAHFNDGHDYFNTFNHHHTQENIWIENDRISSHHHQLSIHIQPNDDLLIMQQSEQEQQSSILDSRVIDIHADDLYISDSSSSDEQDDDLSSYDITNLYDSDRHGEVSSQPIMTRSSSILSQRSEEASISSSVMSYQSLADILNKNNSFMAVPPPPPPSSPSSITSTPSMDQTVIIEEVIQPTVVTARFLKYGSTIAAQSEVHQSSVFDSFKETMETAMNLVRFNFFDNYAANFSNDSSHDVELGTQQPDATVPSNFFIRILIYILYIWQLLMHSAESFIKQVGLSVTSLFSRNDGEEAEREPLL